MDEHDARRERERMVRQSQAPPGSPDAPAGMDRATGVDDPTPRAEYRDDPPEHDPDEVTPPNPQSGYDDTIWVVLKTTWDDRGDPYTRPLVAYRDEEEARSEAEEHNRAHVLTRVECVGLNH